MKNVKKFLNNVSQFFTLELVKPSIESNSHLLERMELLYMLLKRLNRNGTSKNSDKERMKNSGNDHIDLRSTYISAYLLPSYQSN